MVVKSVRARQGNDGHHYLIIKRLVADYRKYVQVSIQIPRNFFCCQALPKTGTAGNYNGRRDGRNAKTRIVGRQPPKALKRRRR